jgi:hypothetical protein
VPGWTETRQRLCLPCSTPAWHTADLLATGEGRSDTRQTFGHRGRQKRNTADHLNTAESPGDTRHRSPQGTLLRAGLSSLLGSRQNVGAKILSWPRVFAVCIVMVVLYHMLFSPLFVNNMSRENSGVMIYFFPSKLHALPLDTMKVDMGSTILEMIYGSVPHFYGGRPRVGSGLEFRRRPCFGGPAPTQIMHVDLTFVCICDVGLGDAIARSQV